MKILLLLLTFYSFSSPARDYTLYQAENRHFRDYTRDELMARLGEVSRFLPHYVCNSKNENDLFFPAPRFNSQEDSLRIQSYKSNEKFFYKRGRFFTLDGKEARDLSNAFVAYVVDAFKKIEAIPEGEKLLRQLERSHFPLTIVLGGNSFSPHDDGGRPHLGIYQANVLSIFSHGRMTDENVPFENIGAGGKIGWNPVGAGLPAHITLAHEMYHAFDSIRGLLDMRFVDGSNYEFALLSEYRAVYFENTVRKAAGIKYRTHYGETQTGPGVLDENGEPRKLPTPCL